MGSEQALNKQGIVIGHFSDGEKERAMLCCWSTDR